MPACKHCGLWQHFHLRLTECAIDEGKKKNNPGFITVLILKSLFIIPAEW